MNRDTATGKFNQLKGKAKQSVGEALGDEKLANSGTVDQVKGAVQESWGNAKDAVHAIADDAHSCCTTKQNEARQNLAGSAHDVRERIAATVQKAKSAVAAKAEVVQRGHKHCA